MGKHLTEPDPERAENLRQFKKPDPEPPDIPSQF